jgi:poly(3-hydroxybutyrate) depolymerase
MGAKDIRMKQRWRSTTVVAIGLMGGLFAWAQYAAALQTLPDKERPPADGKYLSQKLKHDGMDRSYRIYVPTSYREKQAVPLVIV